MRGESRYRALAVGDYEGGRPETVDSNFDRQIRGGGPWGGGRGGGTGGGAVKLWGWGGALGGY